MRRIFFYIAGLLLVSNISLAQDAGKQDTKAGRPVRDAFKSSLIFDNQAYITPAANTLEMIIHHRFGTINNGASDLWGIYAPSNIRMGLNYSLTDNLLIGLGTTKYKKLQDFQWKYKFIEQTRTKGVPVSVSYYGNITADARNKDNFDKFGHRFSYFHQVLIARKINNFLTLQLSPSFSHFNVVDSVQYPGLKHDNFAMTFDGRANVTPQTSIIFEYSQQLTMPKQNSPKNNLAIGVEFATPSHEFQIFLANYSSIINQYNHVFNQNDLFESQFLIGFNMTKTWGL